MENRERYERELRRRRELEQEERERKMRKEKEAIDRELEIRERRRHASLFCSLCLQLDVVLDEDDCNPRCGVCAFFSRCCEKGESDNL